MCRQLIKMGAGIFAATMLFGCSVFSSQPDETSRQTARSNDVVGGQITFIPIIYPDRVVELEPKTGRERVVPDEDLIVENGKVWGRYLRLGDKVEYIMSYHNQLCAPALVVDLDTIGETSRPVRSFALPEPKYDDCKEEQMKKAVKRIRATRMDSRKHR